MQASDPLVADAFQQLAVSDMGGDSAPPVADVLPAISGRSRWRTVCPDALDPTGLHGECEHLLRVLGDLHGGLWHGAALRLQLQQRAGADDVPAGGSLAWQFGAFTPTGGNAPAGTYSLRERRAFSSRCSTRVIDTDLRRSVPGRLSTSRTSPLPAFETAAARSSLARSWPTHPLARRCRNRRHSSCSVQASWA